jgi:hypothetical protein
VVRKSTSKRKMATLEPKLQVDRRKITTANSEHPLDTTALMDMGFKELAVPPGKLGVTLLFVGKRGAIIEEIDPDCAVSDKIKVGDLIVSIDGVELTEASLQVGNERERVFRIIPSELYAATSRAATARKRATTTSSRITGKRATSNNSSESSSERPATKRQREPEDGKQSRRKQIKNTHHETVVGQSLGVTIPGDGRQELHLAALRAMPNEPAQPMNPFVAFPNAARNAIAARAAQQKDEKDAAEFENWKEQWKQFQTDIAHYYEERHADGWEVKYRELLRYQEDHPGDGINTVPINYRDRNDLTLGEWVQKQKDLFSDGKLDKERMQKLLRKGFDFQCETVSDSFIGDGPEREYWVHCVIFIVFYLLECNHFIQHSFFSL